MGKISDIAFAFAFVPQKVNKVEIKNKFGQVTTLDCKTVKNKFGQVTTLDYKTPPCKDSQLWE